MADLPISCKLVNSSTSSLSQKWILRPKKSEKKKIYYTLSSTDQLLFICFWLEEPKCLLKFNFHSSSGPLNRSLVLQIWQHKVYAYQLSKNIYMEFEPNACFFFCILHVECSLRSSKISSPFGIITIYFKMHLPSFRACVPPFFIRLSNNYLLFSP